METLRNETRKQKSTRKQRHVHEPHGSINNLRGYPGGRAMRGGCGLFTSNGAVIRKDDIGCVNWSTKDRCVE